jgi:hypothetical protein
MSENNELTLINMDDLPKQEDYLDAVSNQAVPRGRYTDATEYWNLHRPVQGELCSFHGLVDCVTCRMPCPICKVLLGTGCEHIPVQAPNDMRPVKKSKNTLLRVFAKPQSGPRIDNIWQERREELKSIDDPVIVAFKKIAWKSAKKTTFANYHENWHDLEQRVKDTTGFIMSAIVANMDKLMALPEDQRYKLAKTIAMRRGSDYNTTAYSENTTPVTQYRGKRGQSRWYKHAKRDSIVDYDPSQNDMDRFDSFDSIDGVSDSKTDHNWSSPYWKLQMYRLLDDAMNQLPRKERLAIDLTYLPEWNVDGEPRTLGDVAQAMASYLGERVTPDQARYCLKKALASMKTYVAESPNLVTQIEIEENTLR